jgi:3-isopropylmalate dehydrogenase
VLPGEGIGPEVVSAALTVLKALESVSDGLSFELRMGGPIGLDAVREGGEALSEPVCDFCDQVFAAGGAVLAGAGGGRFVYDMRRRFDLYCKISPLLPSPELSGAGALKAAHTQEVDILVIRENSEGIYQGTGDESSCAAGGRVARHTFSYSYERVERLLEVAAAIARERRGELTVVVKPSGVPTVSALWSDCAREVTGRFGIGLRELEIDYAAFHVIQEPRRFDVVATPNLFGDVMSDVGGLLLRSRGLCYGASYSPSGAAVYQTNHGAAHDFAGTDRANPVGQILSVCMLLHESFGLTREADLIEAAIADVWRSGIRTQDVTEAGCQVVGTREMAARIADAVCARGTTAPAA